MPPDVTHLEGTPFQQSRAFSPAIVTTGGRTVWLSGQTTTTDLDGRDIAWDFDAQVRACYALIGRTLGRRPHQPRLDHHLHPRCAPRRPAGRVAEGGLPGRELPVQRPHHRRRLRPPRHPGGDPGHRRGAVSVSCCSGHDDHSCRRASLPRGRDRIIARWTEHVLAFIYQRPSDADRGLTCAGAPRRMASGTSRFRSSRGAAEIGGGHPHQLILPFETPHRS